jgi:glucans biosynthesis protein
MQSLDYDGYRKIRFRPERSLWRGEPGRFEIQLFHPGPFYRDPVAVSVLEGASERRIPFTSDLFRYDGLERPPPTDGFELTGLRIHTALNRGDYRDEVLTFHGASYFRALGAGNVYGLSARGLSIDLGAPTPEEFPRFTRLALVRPGARDPSLWILALLESKRATGAYAFRLQPGTSTVLDVSARVFVRDAQASIGLAPASSMFLCGEEAGGCPRDYRPEVHDSDGLALAAADGERLFRPLRNPPHTVTSSFRLDAPRGFGLLQRDRDFDHYQDLEARYQDRPSLWVEPLQGFERGSVRLLEIATKDETGDNIALAWVPEQVPVQPQPLALRYRLHFGASVGAGSAGWVYSTRSAPTERGRRFVVDFRLPEQEREPSVEAIVSAGAGRVLEQHVEDNRPARTWRASFEVEPAPDAKVVELRAFLRAGSHTLTETWSYAWHTE